MNTTVLHHADGVVRVESLADGTNRLSIEPNPGLTGARLRWATRYPTELIQEILAAKGLYVCDEIMREEDPRYVEHCLRNEVLGYVDAAALARMRSTYFGRTNVKFLRSPTGDRLPDGIGVFDCIMFSAVFEHTGGVPLINYLPDRLALRAARRFSKYVQPDDDWQTLLRRGIRGGSVREVAGILRRHGRATLLSPADGDRIDLWHRGLSARHAWLKRSIWLALKSLKLLTRVELTPSLALAIRKDG